MRRRGEGGTVDQLPSPMSFRPSRITQLRINLSRAANLERDMSQAEFAMVLGVGRSVIQAWEDGTKTPSGIARRLLEVLMYDRNLGKALIKRRGRLRQRLESRHPDWKERNMR